MRKQSSNFRGQTYIPLKDRPKYMLHPNEAPRRIWDAFTALFVMYLCWMIPIQTGFELNNEALGTSEFSAILDVWFCLDVLLNFRTGYYSYGELRMNASDVAKSYVEGWFLVDLAASFPFGIFFSSSYSSKSLKFVKYVKISKLLRLGRLLKYFRQYITFYQVALSAFLCILILHCNCCIWLWAINPCGEFSIAESGEHCYPLKKHFLYLESMYIVVNMLSGGSTYHLLNEDSTLLAWRTPGGTNEIHFIAAIIISISGVIIFAIVISNINQIMELQHVAGSMFRRKYEDIKSEMQHFNMPLAVRERIKLYYDYVWQHHKSSNDDVQLLSDPSMSHALRSQIALHLYKDMILRVPFFSDAHESMLTQLCLNLKSRIYLPDDMIITKGEIGDELYIINRGVTAVLPLIEGLEEKILIYAGAFFGEYALIMNEPRSCSVQAVIASEICILTKAIFDLTLVKYPDFALKMKNLVIQRKFGSNRNEFTQKKIEAMGHKIEEELTIKKKHLWKKVRPVVHVMNLSTRVKSVREAPERETRRDSDAQDIQEISPSKRKGSDMFDRIDKKLERLLTMQNAKSEYEVASKR